MEKVSEKHTPVAISKPDDGYGKIILKFNLKSLFEMICCFLFSKTLVFVVKISPPDQLLICTAT